MSLWPKDCLEMKVIEKQIQEKLSVLPYLSKVGTNLNLHNKPCSFSLFFSWSPPPPQLFFFCF